MEVNVGQLISLIVGAILTLITTSIASRQAMRNSLLVAREQRLLELRLDAYRKASEAWYVASDLAASATSSLPSSDELIDRQKRFIDAIWEARIIFGLSATNETYFELTKAFADVFTSDGEARFEAKMHLLQTATKHSREIEDAWRKTFEGRSESLIDRVVAKLGGLMVRDRRPVR